MTLTRNEDKLKIMCLKRPTALDKLTEKIPQPKGAVPNFGLPKWKVMPLESKIPMVAGPKNAYNFTRRKIGQSLWISPQNAKFNLNDPYCYEMQFTYDSLHDKHLKSFFKKSRNVRHLIKVGLVTDDLDAKCSLRDYNMYRKYLTKLRSDNIKEELKKLNLLFIEEKALQCAAEEAKKEKDRLQEKERITDASKSIKDRRKVEEKLKIEKQRNKMRKIAQRLKILKYQQQEALKLRSAKKKVKAEYVQQRLKIAAEIRRRKIIKTILDWKKKENVRIKNRNKRLLHEQEKKQEIVEKRWVIKQAFQKQQIEQERFLQQHVEQQRKQFIEKYNAKVEKERTRMKKLLENMKLFVRCYIARHLPGQVERICCKKYLHTDMDNSRIGDKMPHMPKSKLAAVSLRKDKMNKKLSLDVKANKKEKGKKQRQSSYTNCEEEYKSNEQRERSRKDSVNTEVKDSRSNISRKARYTPEKDTKMIEQSPQTNIVKNKCRCQIIKGGEQFKKAQ